MTNIKTAVKTVKNYGVAKIIEVAVRYRLFQSYPLDKSESLDKDTLMSVVKHIWDRTISAEKSGKNEQARRLKIYTDRALEMHDVKACRYTHLQKHLERVS